MVYNDKQWTSFLTAVGRDDLLADDRYTSFAKRAVHIDVVYAELARIFQTRSTDDWTKLLDAVDVPAMRMHDLESILHDPHLVATDFFPVVEHPSEGAIRDMKVSATWSDTNVERQRLAPRLGEHGAEVLREAGYSNDEIAALATCGALRLPQAAATAVSRS
jgi:crotonobetainyl-CoA:carnitine CoA-transferase CaiB-like acyl-CoA transferase